MNTRRSFLRSLAIAPLAIAAAPLLKRLAPEPTVGPWEEELHRRGIEIIHFRSYDRALSHPEIEQIERELSRQVGVGGHCGNDEVRTRNLPRDRRVL